MTESFPAILTANGTSHKGMVLFDMNQQLFMLDVDGYQLESGLPLYEFEITDASFRAKGNFFNLTLTGHPDNEVTNFSIEFKINRNLILPNGDTKETMIDILCTYDDMQPTYRIRVKSMQFEQTAGHLEETFIALSQFLKKKGMILKTCASCILHGYEKGGSSMFCFKSDQQRFLAGAEKHSYQHWYGDLDRFITSEIYFCDTFQHQVNFK